MQRRAEPGSGSHGALPARRAPTDVDPEVVAGARPAGSLNNSLGARLLQQGEGPSEAAKETPPHSLAAGLSQTVRESVAGTLMVDSLYIRWVHGPARSPRPQVADPAP